MANRFIMGCILVLAISMGCSTPKKSEPLVGTYIGWMFMDGIAFGYDGSKGMIQKLEIKPDGTYTFQTESSVMMTLLVQAQGTYSRTGNQVEFSGNQTVSMDDGYKKSKETRPHQMALRVENDMLVDTDGKGDPFYYRREGDGPPPLPSNLQLKPSEPKALALIERVEKAYATAKSIRVTGRIKSQGGGFVAKDARFTLLFQSPSKFRFESSIFDGGHEIDRAEITWDGARTCWWYSKEFGETKDRSLGNALSIVAVNFGPAADVLPSLLLAKEVGDDGLSSEYPEATLLPDENIGDKLCDVLQLRSRGAFTTKMWIDKSNGMILRLHEDLRDVTVSFESQRNISIDPKDFMLGKRSKSTAN